MGTYLLRRLLSAAVVLVLVSVAVFVMMHLLPGDALLVKLGQTGRLPADQLARLRHQMGLDQPLYRQYFDWVRQIFNGTMGYSLIVDGKTVSGRIADAIPVTLELALIAGISSLVLGILLGVLAAVFHDGPVDHLLRLVSFIGLAVPSFWLGLLVIIYGTLYLGYSPPTRNVQFWQDPLANLSEFWIPGLILGFALAASIMRMSRSTVLEALREDYARTARAKGLTEQAVILQHVLRNALIPVITIFGNQAAFLFSGALILEVVFALPGLGQLTYNAILQRDYTQIQGDALVVGAVVVLVNLLTDLSYGWLDPRIRLA
ncbi:MAG: ABC transporter permease [Dehalococcoidia bacterium]